MKKAMKKDPHCLICENVARLERGENPQLIQEFKHSYLVLGDHQFYQGYSVILLKEHVRELHELDANTQQGLFAEVMAAGRAVHAAFQPWKMNYSCYGNQVQHVHWHIFPRYESDPQHFSPPWANSARFDSKIPTDFERDQVINAVRLKLTQSLHN